jgi:hypothetical protein
MYLYIVIVVVPVEMWKTDLNVDINRLVFHRGCGKRCGKLKCPVENFTFAALKKFSTGII